MDKEKFITEVVPLRRKLEFIASRLLDNPQDAEDAVQEAFLKMWCIHDDLDSYDSVEALAVQITKHLCVNRLRTVQVHNEEPITEATTLVANVDDPYRTLEQKDSIDCVKHIMEQLPSLQQAVLRMKHVEGLEVKEIAELTGSTPGAVRVTLSRARKKVKELYLKM